MGFFRFINLENLDNRTAEELQVMLDVAYGDLASFREHSQERVRCLAGIRKIIQAMAALAANNQYRFRPELVR